MSANDPNSFIDSMIRAAANALGVSREDAISAVSEQLDVTPEQVSSWASGAEPTPADIANRLRSPEGTPRHRSQPYAGTNGWWPMGRSSTTVAGANM